MQDYYSRVVGELLNYKEYKHRCAVIRIELDDLIEKDRGINYEGVSVQGSNDFHSSTETAVLDRENSELNEELQSKEKTITKIDEAVQGLDPVEKFIIKNKYLTGRIEKDVNIYTHPEFEWGKNKYYDFKDNAVEKMARILGYKK